MELLQKRKGEKLFNEKKFSEAIQIYNQLIQLNPQDKELWLKKGVALENLGKYSEAIECFDEVIKLDSTDISAWTNKADSYSLLGNSVEATHSYVKVIHLNNDKELKDEIEEPNISKDEIKESNISNDEIKEPNISNDETKEPKSTRKASNYENIEEVHQFEEEQRILKIKEDEEKMKKESTAKSELEYFPEIKNVKKLEKIGEGSQGEVFKGRWGNDFIALKQLRSGELISLVQEGNKMKKLNHPNIVKFWGIFTDNENYFLCTEFVSGGALDKYLNKRFMENNKLNERQLLDLAISGAEGMKYLEMKQIIHRDLAARNFLVEIGTQQISLKVSDFGLSRSLETTRSRYYRPHSKNDTYPYQWVALEILTAPTPQDRKYTHQSDVWGFGVTLWELFNHAQKEPFEVYSWKGVLEKLKSGERLERGNIPENIYLIMLECWRENPEERPTFDQLCSKLKKL